MIQYIHTRYPWEIITKPLGVQKIIKFDASTNSTDQIKIRGTQTHLDRRT